MFKYGDGNYQLTVSVIGHCGALCGQRLPAIQWFCWGNMYLTGVLPLVT